ncbi:MAG: hypothetical protein KDB80_14350 [Planctomycetes bacterium]|nr:hypothetical protein [Planctomycetota bacterium]
MQRCLALTLPLLAAALPAQISFPLSIAESCVGNTGSYTITGMPASSTDSILLLGNVDFGATGACVPDMMFAHVPLFRIGSDTRYFTFYDANLPGDQGGVVGDDSSLDRFTVTWGDLDNRGELFVTWCATIRCCGSNGVIVDHEWQFTNITDALAGAPTSYDVDLSFVAYSDFDVFTSSGNVSNGGAESARHLMEHPSCLGEVTEFWGENPDQWEVSAWPALPFALATDPFPGFANAGLPFGPGDYAGCMEWSLVVPEFGSVSVRYSQAINCNQCDQAATVVQGGVGNATMSTTSLGALGTPVDLAVTGGLPSAPGVIFFGHPATPIPLSFVFPACAIETLYVSVPLSTLPVGTDGTGATSLLFPGLIGGGLCGVSLDFQYAALDFVAACPLSMSNFVSVTYGRPDTFVSCFSKAK